MILSVKQNESRFVLLVCSYLINYMAVKTMFPLGGATGRFIISSHLTFLFPTNVTPLVSTASASTFARTHACLANYSLMWQDFASFNGGCISVQRKALILHDHFREKILTIIFMLLKEFSSHLVLFSNCWH